MLILLLSNDMLQGLPTQLCTSPHVLGRNHGRARRFATVLVAALLLSLPRLSRTTAQGSAPGTPAGAVQHYLDAILLGEGEPGTLLCQAEQPSAGPGGIAAADVLSITADTAGLAFETVQQTATWANVVVTGQVVFAIDGLDAPLEVPIRALGLDMFWPVFEEGVWRACSTPPPSAQSALGPDMIARQFVAAAYAGRYEDASALLCESRRGQFSRAAYEATFGTLFEQGVTVNLDAALFEIVEQGEDESIVALEGQIALSWTGQGRSVTIDAERLGFGPVRLIDEDGWKVCPDSPVES